MNEILDLEEDKDKRRGKISVKLFFIAIFLMSLPLIIGLLGRLNFITISSDIYIWNWKFFAFSICYLTGIVLGFIGFVYSIHAFDKKEPGKIKYVGLMGNGAIVLLFFVIIGITFFDVFESYIQ
ncbi:hypothetical protein [Flexithrix dorotheae]|uniref:hypothetical protein n=1 Tax=Flexithrix dorotheae TaxID=70993 RepID=UPI000365935A|nr:hypothetical protein [Flexithrix dorotheae]